jgi:hypothetical protein
VVIVFSHPMVHAKEQRIATSSAPSSRLEQRNRAKSRDRMAALTPTPALSGGPFADRTRGLQTADIARRLMRGGELHQEPGASWRVNLS